MTRGHEGEIMKKSGLIAAAVLLATVGAAPIVGAGPSGAQAPPPIAAEPSDLATATDQIIVRFAKVNQPDTRALADPTGGTADVQRQLGDGAWVVKLDDEYAP